MANNFPPNGQNGQPRSATPSNAAPRAQDGSGAGWIVKPTGNTPPGAASNARPSNNKPNLGGFASPLFGTESDQDDLSATPEEIEKIRRILNDLD
ncbi:MAG: hypothetical protein AB8G77_11515, partial [Rhodothermales bacterium]